MLVAHPDETLHAVLLHHSAMAVLHPVSQRARQGGLQVLIEPAQWNAPHCLCSRIGAAFQSIGAAFQSIGAAFQSLLSRDARWIEIKVD